MVLVPWNLALGFVLEVATLAGLAAAASKIGSGPVRWIGVAAVPIVVASVGAVFNVLCDLGR